MTLAEQMTADSAILINLDEHAQPVTIDYTVVAAIKESSVDSIPVNQFGGMHYIQDKTRLFLRTIDWPGATPPRPNQRYTVDGKVIKLDTVQEQFGVYTLDFQTGTS